VTTADYRLLFNHDGWCVFMQASPYQNTDEPVGPAQVNGYVMGGGDARHVGR
jgi:hypothetical protein